MSDNNWDLGAIVRSCNFTRPNNVVVPSLDLESLTFENDNWNFFNDLLDDDMTHFKGFDEIFSRNCPIVHQKKSDDQSSSITNSTIPVPIITDEIKIMDQNDKQHQLLQPIQPAQCSQLTIPPPPPPAGIAHVLATTPQELIYPQQQLVKRAIVHPTLTMPMSTSLIQTRKRKNQLIKIIYELRQEELTNDTWTWRKYGQKSIRSSPFPRNYYKCSTSKECKARKHIEKSPKAQNLFVVAYIDEHNHPPPTNRNCIIGCTCGSKSKLPKGINIVPRELSFNASSSNGSQRRCFSVSPIISNMPSPEIKNTSPKEKNETTPEEETIILIPNKFVSEDIFKSFDELKEISTCNKFGSSNVLTENRPWST